MNNSFILICLSACVVLCICQPKSGVPHKRQRKKINDTHVQIMRDFCRGNGCKGQKPKWARQRDDVKRHMTNNKHSNEKSDDQIERQLDKIHLAKKALLSEIGLNDVEPADNGFFGGDMLLSEEQADRIIKRAEGLQDPADRAPEKNSGSSDGDSDEDTHPQKQGKGNGFGKGSHSNSWNKGKGKGNGKWGGGRNRDRREVRRKNRAAALSLDTYNGNKWPTNTLNYYINPNTFSDKQADMIRKALKYIQDNTCLKFIEAKVAPYIEYLKTDSSTDEGTCGWAYMGYQGRYNPVHINFNSRICKPTLLGVISHETLHTVGLSHEHTRYDRDRYLQVIWKNVDPQSIDIFDKDDPYDVNPYCNPYDLESVMHYDCYVGARDSEHPTCMPKNDPNYDISRIGTALRPSANDIKLVNKLYCTPASCKDTNPYCGFSCGSCSKYLKTCPKSCDQCPINLSQN